MIYKRLSDLTSVITKGTTPTTVGCAFVNSGINYIKSESITASRVLDRSKFCFITSETHSKLKRSQIQENDILFSMAGMFLGKTGIARKCDIPANTNQAVAIIRVIPEEINYLYVYYYLNQRDIVLWINSLSGQSAQPNINLKQIGDIEIPVPNRAIQDKIATVLSQIDSRIELNTEINENLQQQAQAIFKELFGNSELQPIHFADIADFKYGKMPKKDKILTNGYPLFSGYQIVGYYPEKMFDEPHIIVVARGVGGCGDIKYTPANCYLTNLSIAIMLKNSVYEDYIYRLLKNIDMKILNTGSAQPQITVDSLQKFEISIPTESKAEEYSRLISPIKLMYRKNNTENQKLSALCDTLLPKLMNGEIDVSKVKI